jgi:hypothetical protein
MAENPDENVVAVVAADAVAASQDMHLADE